jgi:hypothetical protein
LHRSWGYYCFIIIIIIIIRIEHVDDAVLCIEASLLVFDAAHHVSLRGWKEE